MTERSLGEGYAAVLRTPTVEEYLHLREIAGLSPHARDAAQDGLKGTLFAGVIESGGRPVGMGRLIGDGGCFFQIVDIAVDPAHQGKGLGKAVMGALMDHINTKLPDTAFVSLLADIPADRLYVRFGFRETAPASIGMSYRPGDHRAPSEG